MHLIGQTVGLLSAQFCKKFAKSTTLPTPGAELLEDPNSDVNI